MDFAQLKTSLKTQVCPAYLLYGTDYFLLNKAVSLVQDVWPDAEVSKFDASTPADEVVASLSSMAFFTSHRIAVYHLDNKTNLSALKTYLQQPVNQSVLLLVDANAKSTVNLPNVTAVNCNPLPAEISVPLIARQIAPHQITRNGAQYLVEATGGDYSLINNELTKFLAFYQDVPVWDVPQLSPYLQKTVDYQIYELGTAILQKDVNNAVRIWQFLSAGNTNEYAIFGGIVSQMRRAYYATATQSDINVVGKILGCSPYAVKYSRRDFGRQAQFVKDSYQLALRLEYQIKSGQITPGSAVSSLIYR